MAGTLLTGAQLLVQWAAAVILILVLTFYFLKDGEQLRDWAVSLFAEERHGLLREIFDRAWGALATYVQGVFLVASLDAVLIGIVLVAVGVPIALPLIVLTFIAAFFPIIGSVLAGVAATLVALVSGGMVDALIVLGAIIAIQQLEGNVFYPTVVGKQLKLHPVAILLVLTAGGVLAGVAGAFLAIPVAAVTSAVIDVMRTRRRRSGPRHPRSVACRAWTRRCGSTTSSARPSTTTGGSARACSRAATGRAGTEDVEALQAALAGLAPARTLDVACGTGFLTEHLPGELTGLDQSAAMLDVAGARIPGAKFVQGDALRPAVRPGTFERVHAAHFYGHLLEAQRASRSSRRRGGWRGELVIVDSRAAPGRRRRGLAGARAQRRLPPPRLQALVHRRGPRGGAGRRRGRACRPVVRGRAFRLADDAGAGGAQRAPGLAVAEARSGPGSGSPPRSAATTRSASAGPCLKPWPDPPPSKPRARGLRVAARRRSWSPARARSGSSGPPCSGASGERGEAAGRGTRAPRARSRRRPAARRRGRAAGPPCPAPTLKPRSSRSPVPYIGEVVVDPAGHAGRAPGRAAVEEQQLLARDAAAGRARRTGRRATAAGPHDGVGLEPRPSASAAASPSGARGPELEARAVRDRLRARAPARRAPRAPRRPRARRGRRRGRRVPRPGNRRAAAAGSSRSHGMPCARHRALGLGLPAVLALGEPRHADLDQQLARPTRPRARARASRARRAEAV